MGQANAKTQVGQLLHVLDRMEVAADSKEEEHCHQILSVNIKRSVNDLVHSSFFVKYNYSKTDSMFMMEVGQEVFCEALFKVITRFKP